MPLAPHPTTVPPKPPAPEREEAGSRVMRFGAAVSAVVLSSVVATTPAAMRVAPIVAGSVSAASAWLALLALAFVPLSILTVVLRHAFAAVRLFDPRALAAGVATAVVWGGATFVALAGLGAFLRATTHHHGLAGVTFGCVGLAIAATIAVFSARVVTWCVAARPSVRWAALGMTGLVVGVGLAFFARVLGRTEPSSALGVDIAAFILAAAFGGGAFPSRSRPSAPFALAGPPLAAIVLVAGVGTLRHSAPLRAAIDGEAPVLAAATELPGVSSLTGGDLR